MSEQTSLLTFARINDIAMGVARGRIDAETIPRQHAQMLGPVVECLSLASLWECETMRSLNWLEQGVFRTLVRDIRSGTTAAQRTGVKTGWIGADQIFDKTHWTGFLMRIAAAMNAGKYEERTKDGVSAMLGEFRSNIYQHSDGVDRCLAAFHASETCFEVAVSDCGRGVLNSLRENPNFADLSDAGRALRLSVSDGISRFPDPRRGHGFTELFKGLANRFSHIRLRSDDHALEVVTDGMSAPKQSVAQKADIPGLFVYSRFDRPPR